ncbi:MAG: Ig-like domain repeat protein [Terriglobales bacterium]
MTTLSARVLANLFSFPPARSQWRLFSAVAATCVLWLLLGAAAPGYAEKVSFDGVRTTTPVKQTRIMRPSSVASADRLRKPLKRRAARGRTAKPMISGGVLTYTCDPTVAASTCDYLNTTIAADYNNTFANANANIYITYGTTGLGQSDQYLNIVSYADYVAALTSNTNQSPVQVAALSALNSYDASPYGSGDVNVTAALGTALGFTGMTGIAPGNSSCTLGSPGCYNAIVTITNDPGTPLYYDNLGGTEPSDAYDFYSVVEHETDEVLGTSSCIYSTGGGLVDGCGSGVPSAVDLFRYSGAGDLILDSSLSTTPGAYFSYNGGTTNGANGAGGSPKFYNTLDNGDDYADFVSSSPDCGTNIAIQDAEGCPGEDAGLSILNDGGGEINILNAVGYSLPAAAAQITITTGPAGLLVSVDGGTPTAAPLVESWEPGSSHTIATTSPQAGGVGVQYVWSNWSDGGAISHSITVPATATTYTASFSTQYQLTTAANPSSGGSVGPLSGNYYAPNTVVNLTAVPNANYSFYNWTGAVANANSASTTVTMSGPQSVTANFAAATTTSLTSSENPSLPGESVTLTATVTGVPAGSGTPTGTVTIYDGTKAIATLPLSGGQATYTTSTFFTGPHFMDAIYSGSPAFGSSLSAVLQQEVLPAQISLSPTSINFANVKPGHTVKKVVTLTNIGTVRLAIGAVSLNVTEGNPSDFGFHRYCGANLQVGRTCSIAVTFTAPGGTTTAVTTEAATLVIVTSAPGSPQEVPITATVLP